MKELRGKTAFITGGCSGIGLGIAKVLAEEGMKVVLTYIRDDQHEEALKYFATRAFQQVYGIRLDVTDREGWVKAADETERLFGPVQVLVNSAGVGLRGRIENATYDDWDWVLGVNLGGVVNSLVTFLPRMLASGEEGHIVNVSSAGGIAAIGQVGLYTTSKFALVGLTEALRTDMVDRKIGVSVYCPGTVKSNIAESAKVRPPRFARTGYPPPPPSSNATPSPMMQYAMDPIEAGRHVLRGIQNNDLFIFSHPEYRDVISARHAALMASIPKDPADEMRVESSRPILSNRIYIEAMHEVLHNE